MSTNPLEILTAAAREAWEQHGQFTAPATGADDPDGRATLYIAGFLVGYSDAWTAAFQGGIAFERAVKQVNQDRAAVRRVLHEATEAIEAIPLPPILRGTMQRSRCSVCPMPTEYAVCTLDCPQGITRVEAR